MPTDPAKTPPDDERRARVRRRVSSAVYGVYVAFATVFILLSIKSLMAGVFHEKTIPLTTDTAAGKACANGVRSLTAALDRGMLAAAAAHDEASATSSFQQAILPEWDREATLGSQCKDEPRGQDAFAALLRLRRAEESFLGRQQVEIAPVRRDVEAYLPLPR